MAVSGFVIEATRKTVSGSQPTAPVRTAPPTESPAASAGTSQVTAAASIWLKNGAFIGNPLPYWRTRPRPLASSFAAS